MSQVDTTDEQDELVRLEILVDADTARDIRTTIADRGWEYAEGLRLLMSNGLAYTKGERILKAVESGALSKDELERTLSRMMETESRLAALRFRAFEIQRANQAWELSTGAIRNENLGLLAVVERLRDEKMALLAENEQLRRKLSASVPTLQGSAPDTLVMPPSPASKSAQRSFWQRLFCRNNESVPSR